jgi:hypothetical protein
LQALTQGADARMKPDEIYDPWGQEYHVTQADEGSWIVSTQHKGLTINNTTPPRR